MNRPVPLGTAGDERLFGGKSASLARALGRGLPVPDGVALSVGFVEAVVRGDPDAVQSLENVVAEHGGRVAVRSSAVGEDDRDSSFAGQHTTVLNVRSQAGLLEAVAEVHRSAHSLSALAYRERMGITDPPGIGVTVQRLVDAECAGVLFTHNPATGADERVIEAAWGLGEAVVSGLVIPDAYRMNAAGVVLERTPGEKDLALRPDAEGGIREEPVAPERVRAPVLDDGRLAALNDLAMRCEDVYGSRLDIEWAFADGRLYLLQCRAITR